MKAFIVKKVTKEKIHSDGEHKEKISTAILVCNVPIYKSLVVVDLCQ